MGQQKPMAKKNVTTVNVVTLKKNPKNKNGVNCTNNTESRREEIRGK